MVISNDTSLTAAYNELVKRGDITADPEQQRCLKTLQELQNTLINQQHTSTTWHTLLPFLRPTPKTIKGCYLYGGVGRGKSMLMDLFYQHTQLEKKRRVHFHAFMLEIHDKLFAYRKKHKENTKAKDPLPVIAQNIAQHNTLLCFDEFQVTDIADAMILGRLFTALFKEGVVIVATSNRHPDDLYKNGLQRKRFLPFIDLLKKHVTLLELDTNQDYRLNRVKAMGTNYFTPLGKKADTFIHSMFDTLTNHATPIPTTLHIQGRNLTLEHTAGDVALTDFDTLCNTALGAADYLEIAREFSTLLLHNIPRMDQDMRNEAKRFVTLIDTLYEHKVKLVCTAEAPTQELYPEGDGAFEFQRTTSRLMEMQSDDYWHQSHE